MTLKGKRLDWSGTIWPWIARESRTTDWVRAGTCYIVWECLWTFGCRTILSLAGNIVGNETKWLPVRFIILLIFMSTWFALWPAIKYVFYLFFPRRVNADDEEAPIDH